MEKNGKCYLIKIFSMCFSSKSYETDEWIAKNYEDIEFQHGSSSLFSLR